MEDIDFDWLDGNWASNNETPEVLTSNSPRAGIAAEQRASQAAEQVDQPSSEQALTLLRLGGWEREKYYDKNNPVYIHYNFGGRSPSVKISGPGIFVQTQIRISS